jgi:hypothetical protein
MNGVKVLRVNAVEEETTFLGAVHDVIRCILAEKDGRTLIDIAEAVGAETKTISNAFNRKHRLSSVFLTRLGQAFGPHCLDPYLALFGARSVPLERGNVADILPMLTRVSCRIAEARDFASPSGPRETHVEKLGYLPEMKRLQRELVKLISEVEGLAA